MSVLPPIAAWPGHLGVGPGDVWMVVADLTRLSWSWRRAGSTDGARELLDALLAAVGPSGTILVPTFNHDLRPGESFDSRNTPTITGALGEAARAHPAFRRTPHPLHSCAVAGSGKEELASSKEISSFGPGSPFAFMRRHGARILALDIDVTYALTYIHHVEEVEQVRYRQWRDVALYATDGDGRSAWSTYRLYAKRAGHMNSTARLEHALVATGAMTTSMLGPVRTTVVDVHALHQVLEQDIRRTGGALIHDFTWERWLRDHARAILRREGPSRSHRALQDHAARPSR
jgi:aminoglycoside 3-N-acetyltransferase